MNKPTVYFDSRGETGNIYHLLGLVSKAMRKLHRETDYNSLRDSVFASQSYEQALAIIRQYVNLIDQSNKY